MTKPGKTTKRSWKLPVALAVVIGLGLTLNNCFGSHVWHQKLTVEVDTPDGAKTGSAITEVRWSKQSDPFSGHYSVSYSGEATVVEVAPGKYLFALIGESSKFLALKVFRGQVPGGQSGLPGFRDVADVPRDAYPLLVTFTDIDDPKTVKRVDPANLAATFGPGVSLHSIMLEITDEPVTDGRVEQVLPWLEEVGRERPTFIPNPPLLSTDLEDPAIQLLSSGSFSTELYK